MTLFKQRNTSPSLLSTDSAQINRERLHFINLFKQAKTEIVSRRKEGAQINNNCSQ